MKSSDQVNELATALSKVQGNLKGAIKDSKNPFFKSNYADLSSVWDACREELSKNGLSVVQCPEEADTGIAIETVLAHSSGQWISSRYVMPVSKSDAQAVGSAITYGRRYALAAMVGVAPEDDDGNAATKAPPKKVEREEITPDTPMWERAKSAYKRDGNLDKVLKSMDMSEVNQEILIDECKEGDINQ